MQRIDLLKGKAPSHSSMAGWYSDRACVGKRIPVDPMPSETDRSRRRSAAPIDQRSEHIEKERFDVLHSQRGNAD